MEETANDILKQIPAPVDLEDVTSKYPVLYEQSMNTVLIQEIIRCVLQIYTQQFASVVLVHSFFLSDYLFIYLFQFLFYLFFHFIIN